MLAALAAATILSKRGSPLKESQHGLNRRSPYDGPAGILATISSSSSAVAREASSEIVNLAVVLAQQDIAQRHGKLLVNGRRLGFGKKFLKPRIVADRVPDGIDFQAGNGNGFAGRN